MKTVQVIFTVQNEHIEEFIRLTKLNVLSSKKESGVVFFHLFQLKQNTNSFLLFEQYKTVEDQLYHREQEHYKLWKNGIVNILEKTYEVIDLIEIE